MLRLLAARRPSPLTPALAVHPRRRPGSARSRRPEVVIVTENAYPPLSSSTEVGEAIGWSMTAIEPGRAPQLHPGDRNILLDAMMAAVSEGQFDLGMTGITIRDDRKETGRLSDATCAPRCSGWSAPMKTASPTRPKLRADDDLLMGAQPALRPSMWASTTSSNGKRAKPPHHPLSRPSAPPSSAPHR
jgi:polar amino acid transport system substrate-binding protein